MELLRQKTRQASVVVVSLCLFAGVLCAQSTNASLTGRATDPSKARIVEAKVTAISSGTNSRHETATNDSGEYCLSNLAPGTYGIEVEKPGFKKLIKPGLILHVLDSL